MRELDLTATITLDDGDYDFLEHGEGLMRLRCVATGATVIMHSAELAQRAVGPLPAAVINARVITSISAKQQERTLLLANHLREIETGVYPGLAARPQYDPANTQEQRVQAKLAELEATNLRMSRSTLYAHLYDHRKGGVTAVIDGRAMKATRTPGEDRSIITEALLQVLAAQANESTGTATRIIALTWEEVLRQYGADAPTRPSERTMHRLVKVYSKGRHSTGSAKTRRSLADRPDTPFNKRMQTLPGAEVQLDTNLIDVMVRVPGAGTARPQLTIMLDVATRSILAFTIRLTAAKAIDHIALLAQSLTPIQNRPDRTQFRTLVQQQNPGRTLLSPERLAELAQHRPFVRPRSLTIDNGKDFKSNALIAAAGTFGMNVVFSPPRTPVAKPHVERTFNSIGSLFCQYLPGYVSRSPEFRGIGIQDESKLLDIFALQELFHDWVLNVYQNRPHSALSDPLHPAAHFTPNQMAAAAAQVVSTFYLPLTRQDYIGLLPKEKRALRSTGFHLKNHRYDAPELHAYRGRTQSMDIHYDPHNPQTVWARSPEGALIECAIRDWNATSNPFFADFYPDEGEQPPTPAIEPTSRAQVALIGTALDGVAIHTPPISRHLTAQPTTFLDDDDNYDDVEELTEFDSEGNL